MEVNDHHRLNILLVAYDPILSKSLTQSVNQSGKQSVSESCIFKCSAPLFSVSVRHHHLSLNREGRLDTTNDFATSFLHFLLFSTALWDSANSRPVHSFPDVVFSPPPLSASSSSPFHCALQDGFGQT